MSSLLTQKRVTASSTSWALLVPLLCGWLACACLLPDLRAADLSLKAQLIWGTDEPKPPNQNLKELEPKLREKLAKVFKWKNYWQVSEKKTELPHKQPKRLPMSPKCEIELRYLDESIIEMKLFGEGKHTGTLRKSVKALEQGELAVLAGDDKDKYGDAWFVVISVPKP